MNKLQSTKYRPTNWKSYNDVLKCRASLMIWLDKGQGQTKGKPGRPRSFSDAAIQLCPTILGTPTTVRVA